MGGFFYPIPSTIVSTEFLCAYVLVRIREGEEDFLIPIMQAFWIFLFFKSHKKTLLFLKFTQLEKIAPSPLVVNSFQYFIMKAPSYVDC